MSYNYYNPPQETSMEDNGGALLNYTSNTGISPEYVSDPNYDKPRIVAKTKAATPLHAMSPLAASATVVNLILATGPFSYAHLANSLDIHPVSANLVPF